MTAQRGSEKVRLIFLLGALIPTLLVILITARQLFGLATINVNSQADNLTAGDSFCTLREAIRNANTGSDTTSGDCAAGTFGADTINLPAGTYDLNLGSPGDDLNMEGDLDILDSLTIQGAGADTTIIRNGYGDPNTLGDGDRIFHVKPGGGVPAVNFTINDISVRDGDVGCSGPGCETGAAAIDNEGNGDLEINSSSILSNTQSCSGTDCGLKFNDSLDSAAVRSVGTGGLTISGSTIAFNEASCTGSGCTTGMGAIMMLPASGTAGPLVIENSFITDNTTGCADDGCAANYVFKVKDAQSEDITNTDILRNLSTCSGSSCLAFSILLIDSGGNSTMITGSTLSANGVSCLGTDCITLSMIILQSGTITLDDITVEQNIYQCIGTPCHISDLFYTDGDLTLQNSRINHNQMSCTGAQCLAEEILNVLQNISITDVTMSNNSQYCDGFSCSVGGVIQANDSNNNDILRLTLDSNSGTCLGEICIAHTTAFVKGTLTDSAFTNNIRTCAGADCMAGGGGLSSINLFIDSSLFANNVTNGFGGGILVGDLTPQGIEPGVMTIVNSTLSGNSAAEGGGIYIPNGPTGTVAVDMVNVTISDNSAGTGAGIRSLAEADSNNQVHIENSIVAGQRSGDDCSLGTALALLSDGHNLESGSSCGFTTSGDIQFGDAALQPLADNGGPTMTQAIPFSSDAYDHGNTATCTNDPVNSVDQRDVSRPQGGDCDIGAYELDGGTLTIVKEADPSDGTDFSFEITPTVPFSNNLALDLVIGEEGSGQGQFFRPSGLAIDGSGNLLVVEEDNARVQVLDTNGSYVGQFGSFGSADGEFFSPEGVAVNSTGAIYIADAGNDRIQIFDSSYNYQDQFGTTGTAEGQFNSPRVVAVDGSGNIYVGDYLNYRVQKFDPAGNFIYTIGRGVDTGAPSPQICYSGCQSGSQGNGPGNFRRIGDIGVAPNGTFYVGDDFGRIQVFDPNGTFLFQFGNTGPNPYNTVDGIDIDSDGTVYAAGQTSEGYVVKVFTSTGAQISEINNGGGNSISNPISDVVVDGSGSLFVSFSTANVVRKYVPVSLVLDDALPDDGDNVSTSATAVVNAGAYEITELLPDNWLLASPSGITCTDDGQSILTERSETGVIVNIEIGSEITCTFHNESRANLSVQKETDPDGDPQQFEMALMQLYSGPFNNTDLNGFTVDNNGNLMALIGTPPQVVILSSTFESLLQFGAEGSLGGQFNPLITSAAVDPATGDIYVADSGNLRMQKFDSSGHFIWAIGWGVDTGANNFEICTVAANCQAGSFGDGAGQFIEPLAIAVDSSGSLYVGDTGNYRVQKFDSSGNFLRMWGWGVDTGANNFEICTVAANCQAGIQGNGTGQFDNIEDIAIGASDRVYVIDNTGRVQIFEPVGTYVGELGAGTLQDPDTLDTDGAGNIYVQDDDLDNIFIFDSSGALIGDLGYLFQDQSLFWGNPAVDDAGNLYLEAFFDDEGIRAIARAALFDLADGQSQPFNDLVASDTRTRLLENVPDGWILSAIGCGDLPLTGIAGGVQFILPAGEDVSCTLTNTKASSLTIVKETDPSGGQNFDFTVDSDQDAVLFQKEWGQEGPADGDFESPSYIATDAAGNVYVTDDGNNRIQKFDVEGNHILSWGGPGSAEGEFQSPAGIAVSGNRVYVSENDNARIQVFDLDGNFIEMWGWGVDTGANSFEICTTGSTPCQGGIFGAAAGQFDSNLGLDVDSTGNVYVVDNGNNRVQKFDSSGAFLASWGWDVDSVNPATGFEVCTAAANCQAGLAGNGAGQFDEIYNITIDGNDAVYTVESGNQRVQKFNSSGAFLRMWGWGVDTGANSFEICTAASTPCQSGIEGAGQGQFAFPEGIDADPNGDIIVTDGNNSRLQKFDSDGSFLILWGEAGTGPGQLNDPEDVASSPGGLLYVVDEDNNKVLVYLEFPAEFTLDDTESQTFPGLLPGSYAITETVPSGWILGGIVCDGEIVVAIDGAIQFDLAAGQDSTCTFTNLQFARLTLVKEVTNDSGGTALADEWTLSATGDLNSFSGSGVQDQQNNVAILGPHEVIPGVTYTLSEDGPGGYLPGDWDCHYRIALQRDYLQEGDEITLEGNEDVVCTITNDDIAPELTVIKEVVNDNEGGSDPADFTMNVAGSNVSNPSFPGDENGTTVTLYPGDYEVTESGPGGYMASFSADCVGSIALGESKTCTVENDDIPETSLTLVKTVTNDNGGSALAEEWTLSASGSQNSFSGNGTQQGGENKAILGPNEVTPGVTYTLSEDGPAGYTAGDWICLGADRAARSFVQNGDEITLEQGENVTCTINNNDIAQEGRQVFITESFAVTDLDESGDPNAIACYWLTLSEEPLTPVKIKMSVADPAQVTLGKDSVFLDSGNWNNIDATFKDKSNRVCVYPIDDQVDEPQNELCTYMADTMLGQPNITPQNKVCGDHQTYINHEITDGPAVWTGGGVSFHNTNGPDFDSDQKTVDVLLRDDDTAAVRITESYAISYVDEGGTPVNKACYWITLDSQPSAAVTIDIAPDNNEVETDKSSVTLGPGNFKLIDTTFQLDFNKVCIFAIDDHIDEPDDTICGAESLTMLGQAQPGNDVCRDHLGQVAHSIAASTLDPLYGGGVPFLRANGQNLGGTADDPAVIDVLVGDNDTANLIFEPSSLNVVEGQQQTVNLSLSSQPKSPVQVAGSEQSHTFDQNNWNQPKAFTVAVAENNLTEGTKTEKLPFNITSEDPDYASLPEENKELDVTVIDNDAPGLQIDGGVVTLVEGGSGGSYGLRLISQPGADVTVEVDSGSEVNASPAILTFTPDNWDQEQTVNLAAVDDEIDEGATRVVQVSHKVLSPGSTYDNIIAGVIEVQITDNDQAGIQVNSQLLLVSEGGQVSFKTTLNSKPQEKVYVTFSSAEGLDFDKDFLLFDGTNWDKEQTITATAVDDAYDTSPGSDTYVYNILVRAVSNDKGYDQLTLDERSVEVLDDETAGVQLSVNKLQVTEGEAAKSYTVALTSKPLFPVTVLLNSTGEIELSASCVIDQDASECLRFTPDNWNKAQKVSVTAVDDVLSEFREKALVLHTPTGSDPAYTAADAAELEIEIGDDDNNFGTFQYFLFLPTVSR